VGRRGCGSRRWHDRSRSDRRGELDVRVEDVGRSLRASGWVARDEQLAGRVLLHPAGKQVGSQLAVLAHPLVERLPDPAYLLEEHACIGRPQVLVARCRAGDQSVDVRRQAGHAQGRCRDVLVHVLVGDLDRAVGLVRLVAGEHLVEEDAGGVHVGAGVGLAVDDELGGEVGDGADQDPTGRRVLGLGVDRAGEPEVRDLDPARA
jgi:hypothetical protein